MMDVLRLIHNRLKVVDDAINRVCWWLAGTFLCALLVFVMLQVVARYGFHSPPSWTEEAARYCMVWAGLLGGTVAYHDGFDPVLVRLDAVRSRGLLLFFRLVQAVATCLFMGPVVYYGPSFVERHMHRLTETLEITSGYVVFVVPLFAGVILFHMAVQLFDGPRQGAAELDD